MDIAATIAATIAAMSGREVQALHFPYARCADQDAPARARHRVVVVGAGPVGLSLAIDLAQRGQPVLLLDNDHKLSAGSRAICFAKRTLEIWDRLGAAEPMVGKGVSWNVGKVFFGERMLYAFDLLPEAGHERPAFINLQQYYAEAHLVRRALALPNLQLRWGHAVAACEAGEAGVTLGIDTPEGRYAVDADYVVACDGARSTVRGLLHEEPKGRVFKDRFLIADVRLQDTGPAESAAPPAADSRDPLPARSGRGLARPGARPERWFWFDPPFHRNQSALLHSQPDGVWRIDFQLGWDADPDEEKKPERIIPRVKAMLGDDVPFELEWASVYTFACERMASFRHGRVFFAGDAAHRVSPFGARGANSGVQDADNLAWKLDRVLRGASPPALLDSYGIEREMAADENVLNSTRATDFITPKSEVSRLFRDAVLDLAGEHEFARALVNSGRLSLPSTYAASPLNTPDADPFEGPMVPGAPAADAPVRVEGRDAWLLRELGDGFTLMFDGAAPAWAADLPVRLLCPGDRDGLLARRYDLRPGTAYLFRPDQHVCARWRAPTPAAVQAALKRATAC
jgi:3-(3-hydroxy-phenyl)propionate hydroxylase